MFNNRRKKSINRLLLNKITLAVVGFIIIIAISIPLARNVSKQYRINKEVKDLEKEIVGLKSKNSNLNGLIDYLKSDQFNEEQARLKLNYKKEGEEVAVIKDESADNLNNDEGEINYFNFDDINKNTAKKEVNNSKKWFIYFLGT
ncbi:hypothetical protein DRH27_04350 [Candidatus Falkowbacteria bacterium]|nr:MAG: hypothetical protein DRH27_04350 [Candidatus Falkowbacteria bacterium]